jgi:hypothetical protein
MTSWWRLTLVMLAVVHVASMAHAERSLPSGVVLAVGDVDLAAALRAAKTAGGARWRGSELRPQRAHPPATPQEAVEKLKSLYLEADFIGCLSQMQNGTLDIDAMIFAGQRAAAGTTCILAAACAFDAGDKQLAQSLLMRATIAELPTKALEQTKPGVQRLMETLQAEAMERPRVPLIVRSDPPDAAIRVDGVASPRCRSSPCRLHLRKGRHLLRLTRLGYLPRLVAVELEAGLERIIALDPAPAARARRQLADALSAGAATDTRAFVQTIAQAEQVQVVVVATHDAKSRAGATLYDHQLERIVARSRVTNSSDGVASAVRAVIAQWRGEVEDRPLWKRPLFWGITVGSIAATAVMVFLLTRPAEERFAIEVPRP